MLLDKKFVKSAAALPSKVLFTKNFLLTGEHLCLSGLQETIAYRTTPRECYICFKGQENIGYSIFIQHNYHTIQCVVIRRMVSRS